MRQRLADALRRRRRGGKPRQPLSPCGTYAAYKRHLAAGEKCDVCVAANASYSHQRRARERGNGQEPYSRLDVFEWDAWTCQMCQRKVKVGGKREATIDHIIPVSLGGPDTRANVQTACRSCNTRKSNRAANDQTRLFGPV